MKNENLKKVLPYATGLVAFVLFAILYCYPLLDGKVLHAGDVINWKGAAHEVQEYHQQTGEISWWTNSMFGGMPTYQITGALGTSKVRNTMETIAHLGFSGDWHAVGIIIGYLTGFFLMLLCFGINPWLSIIGAIALTLSTYFMLIIPAGHITKAVGLGFLAPVIGGVYAIFRQRYRIGIALVVVYGILSVTIHPQMTFYIALLLGVMACTELYIAIREKKWKVFGINAGVLVLCALVIYGTKVSWFQMNNEYLKETMRGGHSELNQSEKQDSEKAGLDLDYATAWSYGKAETMTFLIPNFMGGASGYNAGEKSVLYKELVKARVPKGSAKQFCQSAPTYWGEKAFTSGPVYMGAIICFLFILGLLIVPGPYKWGLLVATLFSVMLAWGRNFMALTEFFYNYFPMYNKFRAVESILVVAEITIPLLGFLGLHKLYSAEDRKVYRKPIYIAAGITAGLCLLFALFGGSLLSFTSSYDNQWKSQVGNDIYQMIVDQRISMLKADAWRSFGFIAAASVVLWLYTADKLKRGYVLGILAILVLADLVPVNRRFFGSKDFVTSKDNDRYFAIQPWEEQILRDQDLDYRVLNLTANTFNDARTSYRLKSIGGYSAAKLRRYQDLIDAHISRNNFNVLNMLNTRYFITRNGVQRNAEAMGNAWFVDNVKFVDTPDEESQALWEIDLHHTAVSDKQFEDILSCAEASTTEGDYITMTAYSPNKLDYQSQTANERVAVFSEIYYPHDWHLYCDGEELPIGRVNYMLRAAIIPAGNHHLQMSFVPSAIQTDKWCMLVLIIALVLSIGLITYPLYRPQLCRLKKK